MSYNVIFEGGPRDGKTRNYLHNPRVVCCVDEWKAAGIKRGLYRDSKTGDGSTGSPRVLQWVEV